MEITTVSMDKTRRDALAELKEDLGLPHYDATIAYLLEEIDGKTTP